MTNGKITTDNPQPSPEPLAPGNQSPPDRAAINRANSQHSTGPRTEAGKQRSRLNAMRHGLTGQTVLLPEDDLELYQRRNQEFFTHCKPKGPIEIQYVQTLADTAWRLNRVTVLENSLLALGIAEHEASVDTEHPQVLTGIAMAKTYREQNQVMANLATHGQRLARLFKETDKRLREVQAERHSLEKEQLNNAAILMEMHKDEGVPYDPAQDGFVFSPAEIDICIQRNQRLTQARRADLHRPCPPTIAHPPCQNLTNSERRPRNGYRGAIVFSPAGSQAPNPQSQAPSPDPRPMGYHVKLRRVPHGS